MTDPGPSRYIVGIDLGTTNSVVSSVDTEKRTGPGFPIAALPIAQLVAPAETRDLESLPSFLYLPAEGELAPGSLALPWDPRATRAVGVLARLRGAEVPGRLVHSAKSWLCHARVDRTEPILPWGAAEDVARVSPVEASRAYLEHLAAAWRHARACPLEEQEVVLTVPASFDDVARELTVEAARSAGLTRLTLLEEPQAAFASWLDRNKARWREIVAPGQRILVVDVGGGTADFSLIDVEDVDGTLGFRRAAVGEHLLLGGDNMDLALAARCEAAMGGRLDGRQWSALAQACRAAKETLLAPDGPDQVTVTVAGRGSRLVGGTRTTHLAAADVLETVLDGFFPVVAADSPLEDTAGGGIQEMALPFATDAALTRQLAAFLREPSTGRPRRPDHVLFNGGVFKPAVVRQRVLEVLASWFEEPPRPVDLDPDDLDRAVSRGAAYHGLVRRGEGIRIAGGTARSYYVALGSGPGRRPTEAICVAPQGLEEGRTVAVGDRQFDLLIRQPVGFPVLTSTCRPDDAPGDVIAIDRATMAPLAPIRTVLRSGRKKKADRIRVAMSCLLTEVGILEVWLDAVGSERRWRLDLDVRAEPDRPESEPDADADADDAPRGPEIGPESIDAAAALIERTYPARRGPGAADPAGLMKGLEKALGARRRSWPTPVLRELWPALLEVAGRRRTDGQAEGRWLNLAGFLLRPGHGYPGDELRVGQVWRLFDEGLATEKDVQVEVEWWVLWRRVAGGLSRAQQRELYRRVSETILASAVPARKGRKGESPQVENEMWRAAASLERLTAADKVEMGRVLLARLARQDDPAVELWALGRLGARLPIYGPLDATISPSMAAEWIEALLAGADLARKETHFALATIARRSGDRVRDLGPTLRERVATALEEGGATEAQVGRVREVARLDAADAAEAFGEALPVGLRLAR